MEWKVRIAVYAVIGALLLTLALCSARGVGNIISGKVVSMTSYDVPEVEANADDAGSLPENGSEMLIYNRNLFNQKAEASEAEPEAEVEETEPSEIIEEIASDGQRPVLTDLRILLKGTQVGSDPAYSLAMVMPLEGGNDARMLYLGEGSDILGEARIIKIVRNRIYMHRTTQGDRLEYLDTRTTEEDLDEAKKSLEKAAAAEKVAAERATAAAEKAKKSVSGTAEIVKRTAPDTYEVSRDAIEAIRKNPNSLKNNAQYGAMPKVQPVYKNGNIGGFRLLGVDNGSIYAQLGLKSGDTIVDVNGQTIDGPQKAMALLEALKPGQTVGLKINRAGQEKTLKFSFK